MNKTDLLFLRPRLLKIGVPAALGVVLAVSISVPLPVPVLVFGRLRDRARGQDVIADVVEDAEQTVTPPKRVTLFLATVCQGLPALPTHLRSASGALFSSSLPGKIVFSSISVSGRRAVFCEDPPAKVTFVLLLELLVPGPLAEVRQDLSQLRDHDVVGRQSCLSLKDRSRPTVRAAGADPQVRGGGLHPGAVPPCWGSRLYCGSGWWGCRCR